MRALIIGNEGFVGRHLQPAMRQAGYKVTGTEDFEQFVRLGDFGAPFDVVVHLGANIVNVDARMKMGMDAYSDIALDLAVCSWIERHPPTKCFVVMSSCAVDYPDDPYCTVKRALEAFAQTLHKRGVPLVVLRPFSGYGPDQSEEYPFRAIFERALRKEDPLTVWGGGQVRDWLHIDDLCRGIMTAIDRFPRGGTFEIGTGVGTSLGELAEMIAFEVGYDPAIKFDASKASSSSLRVAMEHGQSEFGFMPTVTLHAGIRRAADIYRAQGRLK